MAALTRVTVSPASGLSASPICLAPSTEDGALGLAAAADVAVQVDQVPPPPLSAWHRGRQSPYPAAIRGTTPFVWSRGSRNITRVAASPSFWNLRST